ncbi:sel1 repeat family protein [Cereibacter sphaeroides]|uniref:SEL1-like repeat protein n=1 Tax=Cereibacter sphaeroides TaxID=1063 RepID=UPI000E5A5CC1|nr:SEL1-like repeat protein [Cereibacter sphaeroides]RHZ93349.1 sel1 repeat family protein [Cereibacter sphaeroides]
MRGAALLCLALSVGAATAAETASQTGADPFAAAIAAFRAGDAGRAAVLFKTLAEAGEPEAQFNLALLYAEGAGLPQNPREALYWAWRAQIAGIPRAEALSQRLTAALPDEARADLAERLERVLAPGIAAGDARAMFGLARVLLQLRPEPDAKRAYEWFAIAAALGLPEAQGARDAALAEVPEPDRFAVQDGALAAFAEWCRAASRPAVACAAAG